MSGRGKRIQFPASWVCPRCGVYFVLRPEPLGALPDRCTDCTMPFWRHRGLLGMDHRPKPKEIPA
jgi:hypothetical protein